MSVLQPYSETVIESGAVNKSLINQQHESQITYKTLCYSFLKKLSSCSLFIIFTKITDKVFVFYRAF